MKLRQIKTTFIDQSCLFSGFLRGHYSWGSRMFTKSNIFCLAIFSVGFYQLFAFKVEKGWPPGRLLVCEKFSISRCCKHRFPARKGGDSFLRHEKLSTFLHTLFPGTAKQSILTVHFHVPAPPLLYEEQEHSLRSINHFGRGEKKAKSIKTSGTVSRSQLNK